MTDKQIEEGIADALAALDRESQSASVGTPRRLAGC
jgi:hypothetical protein